MTLTKLCSNRAGLFSFFQDIITRSGVTYELVSHIPRVSDSLEDSVTA